MVSCCVPITAVSGETSGSVGYTLVTVIDEPSVATDITLPYM